MIGLAGATACHKKGIDAYFSIVNHPMSLEEAMKPEIAFENIKQTTEQIFNLIKAIK